MTGRSDGSSGLGDIDMDADEDVDAEGSDDREMANGTPGAGGD